jgi:hypothetical protein
MGQAAVLRNRLRAGARCLKLAAGAAQQLARVAGSWRRINRSQRHLRRYFALIRRTIWVSAGHRRGAPSAAGESAIREAAKRDDLRESHESRADRRGVRAGNNRTSAPLHGGSSDRPECRSCHRVRALGRNVQLSESLHLLGRGLFNSLMSNHRTAPRAWASTPVRSRPIA